MLNTLQKYEEIANENGTTLWYAVTGRYYDAWDNGSHDLAEAIEMLKEMLEEDEDAEIAIIDEADSYCVDAMDLETAEDELMRKKALEA